VEELTMTGSQRMVSWVFVAVAAIAIILLPRVSGAQGAKFIKCKVNGKPLTDQEIYVLEQAKAGKVADLLERFVVPLIPEQERQEILNKGLTGYLNYLEPQKKDAFLQKYQQQLGLGACFLEILVSEGFPNMKVHWRGVRIKNAVFTEELDMGQAEISHTFFLQNCLVQKPVNFTQSIFKKSLAMPGTHFLAEADFSNSKVDKSASFNSARFKGMALFGSMKIGGNFSAEEAEFCQKADFHAIKIEERAVFDRAKFHGEISFDGAKIGDEFSGKEAIFKNPDKEASFTRLKVSSNVFFNMAKFFGPVDFGKAEIGKDFSCKDAQFLNKQQEKETRFVGMRVDLGGLFMNVTFHGKVSFAYSHFTYLRLEGREEKESHELITLVLLGARIQRNLTVKNFKIDTLNVSSLQVNGNVTFEDLKIITKVDFKRAALGAIEVKGINWPGGGQQAELGGLTYNSLTSKDHPYSNQVLLTMVESSDYDSQNYQQLEEYFKRKGRMDWADTVYIAMKRREMQPREWYEWFNPLYWFTKFLWDWPVGFGRNPLNILWFALPFILVGAWIFNPKYLKGVEWPEMNLLRRLFLSLDKFSPNFFDFGFEKNWHPESLSKGVQTYSFIHKMTGRISLTVFFVGVWEFFR